MACLLIFQAWIGSSAHARVSVSKDIEAPVDKAVDTRQADPVGPGKMGRLAPEACGGI